jgi:hypothetical protein
MEGHYFLVEDPNHPSPSTRNLFVVHQTNPTDFLRLERTVRWPLMIHVHPNLTVRTQPILSEISITVLRVAPVARSGEFYTFWLVGCYTSPLGIRHIAHCSLL